MKIVNEQSIIHQLHAKSSQDTSRGSLLCRNHQAHLVRSTEKNKLGVLNSLLSTHYYHASLSTAGRLTN